MLDSQGFIQNSRPFIDWMLNWYNQLPALDLAEVSQKPAEVAVASIDLIKGFTSVGVLASPRIAATVPPTAALFRALWERGVRDFVLLQDSHPPDAVEFAQYGVHCLTGSLEAEPVDEFVELPFFPQMDILPKNSTNPFYSTGFEAWLAKRPQLKTFITVGDCSDICTYQLALSLRLRFNAANLHGMRVIAPVNTIDTYDLPVETALQIGVTPHAGEFLHVVFLYHMMLNGVEVVRAIE
jgi:nicotinamidase-related amidase